MAAFGEAVAWTCLLRTWSLLVLLLLRQSDAQDTCGGTFGDSPGVIASPNFPNTPSNMSDCIYLITSSPGQRITLTFTDFSFREKYLDKCIDYLMIQDGALDDSPTLGMFCGSDRPGTQRTTQNTMRVTMLTNATWNQTHFRANYTSAFIPNRLLLVTALKTNSSAIVGLDLDVYSYINIPVQGFATPMAIDFDPTDQRMYWTSSVTASVNSVFLNGSDSRTDYTFNLDSVPECRGLAVDYMSRLIFYTDTNNGVIGMLTIHHRCSAKLIVSTDIARPHAIVLDMTNGVIFWSDVGDSPRIERASYDGRERKAIVTTSLRRPYGLALDTSRVGTLAPGAVRLPGYVRRNRGRGKTRCIQRDVTKQLLTVTVNKTSRGGRQPNAEDMNLQIKENTLYWVDAALNRIEKFSLHDSHRTLVYSLPGSYFYGLAFYRGYLYVTNQAPFQSNTTNVRSFIHKVDTATGTIAMNWTSMSLLSDVHCYDEENTAKASNGCTNNNCDDSMMCIPRSGSKSACLSPDSESCALDLPGCGGIYTSPSGIIKSPLYPRNYTDNLDCIYHIMQPPSYRITLSFLNFDLPKSPSCTADFLEIHDGDKPTSPLLGVRLCGMDVDPPVQRSAENAMRIRFKTDGSTTGAGFLINYTAAVIPKSFLLFVDSSFRTVFRMDPEVHSYTRLPIQDLRAPVAISYDPEEDRVYWTDSETQEIRSAFLNATSNQLVYTLPGNADALCEGLAVDYISRRIFYTDSANDVIGFVSISGYRQQTVVNSGLDQPGPVVLDMTQKLLFWSDSGDSPKIEWANYDGSDRHILVSLQSSRPAGLALDTTSSLLYWADAGSGQVEQIDLKGNRKIFFSRPGSRFFALAVGGGYLYLTDWGPVNSSLTYIRRVKTDSSETSVLGWSSTGILKGLHLYDETTRLHQPASDNAGPGQNVALIAGAAAGGFVGLLVVTAVVTIICFKKKRRSEGNTGRSVGEDSQTSLDGMSQNTGYFHVGLNKTEDEGIYHELDDVKTVYESGGSLRNPYLTATFSYEDTTPPIHWSRSGSYPRPLL